MHDEADPQIMLFSSSELIKVWSKWILCVLQILSHGWDPSIAWMDGWMDRWVYSISPRKHCHRCCLLFLTGNFFPPIFSISLYRSLSLLPAAPSSLTMTMRCPTRRGCWLPKCTRVTSRTSWTACWTATTTNSDLTSEVGPDFSQLIRLVAEAQSVTPTSALGFAVRRVCDVCPWFFIGTLESLEPVIVSFPGGR